MSSSSSSSEQDQVRSLAERIARRLASAQEAQGDSKRGADGATPSDLDALRAGLSEIQRRLAHIEAHITHDDSCELEAQNDARNREASLAASRPSQGNHASTSTVTRSPWLSGTYVPATAHPSQERFAGIGDAVSELVEHFEREKTCSMEPGEKPCDQCGMCSARGF